MCQSQNRNSYANLTGIREDDTKWPEKNKDGRQELEIRLGNEHISFEVSFSLTHETKHVFDRLT